MDSVIIEVEQKVLGQVGLTENVLGLNNSLKKFLRCLIESVAKSEKKTTNETENKTTYFVGRDALQDQLKENKVGASNSIVSRRLGELVELKVAIVKRTHLKGGKQVAHYCVNDLTNLVSLPPLKRNLPKEDANSRRRTQKMVHAQKDLFRNQKDLHLLDDPSSISLFLHEQIFNGILDSAMRMSYTDKRVDKIEVIYQCAGDPLYIKTTCGSDEVSEIAALPDQRAMRSVNSLCRRSVSRTIKKLKAEFGDDLFESYDQEFLMAKIPNLFVIDIDDLCRLMKLEPKGENLGNAAGMLQRLADTKFEVDARDNPWFRKTFSLTGHGDIIEFRYLSNLEKTREAETIASMFEIDINDLPPKYYTFSLEPRIFMSLVLNALGKASTIFISHDELSSERSGIVQRFYNWARAYFGGREKPGLKEKWFTLYEIQDHLTPGSPRHDNFRTYFYRMLEKFCLGEWDKQGTSTAKVYGYYIHYDGTGKIPKVQIERDREDHIVGDNSLHQKHLRRQASEALEYSGIEA